MMLKVGSEFLEFDEDVELERQALLFEELSETRGDYSYSFNIPRTHKNCGILGQPLPDNASKPVYTKIDCQLLSDSGSVLHIGFLRVEQLTKRSIITSFFSGNSNWLSLLTGDMTELELSAYDRDITPAEITASWLETEGIVFPVIDTGTLISRSYHDLVSEDFVGSFYLHTLMKEVFQQSGLKLTGELLNDPIYNSIVVATNTRSKRDIDNHKLYVGKSADQTILAAGVGTITFELQSNPYYIGSSATFNTNTTFVAPVDMVVNTSFTWDSNNTSLALLRVNGGVGGKTKGLFTDDGTITINKLFLAAGDTLSVTISALVGDVTVLSASFQVQPIFIYKAFGRSSVPLWTKFDFVSNVLQLFNTVTDYDPYSKTVTINLFDKIKSKPPIDLSAYIDDEEQVIDYVEFISNYGKNSLLSYQESEDEPIQQYNISSFIKYGSGVIEVDNEMIPPSAPILESDFSAPISYINPVFDASFEKINFVEYDDDEETDITSVTNDAGVPEFNVDDETIFSVGDVVRIDSSNTVYNGIWIVTEVGTGLIKVHGLVYDATGTGTVTRLVHTFTSDESVYLFVNVPNIGVSELSPSKTGFFLELVSETPIALAFFNLLNNGTQINTDYKQGLAFGTITDPSFYQRTLLQTYWGTCARVLNDPVKITINAYLPESVYDELNPLTPVYIKTLETVNLYYVNRITGFYPCQIELIKLP